MLRKFLLSFVVGFAGIGHALRSEQNMRLHALAAVGVVVGGFVLGLAAWEWVAIVSCVGLVLSAECMNTAIERLADRVSEERHPLLKQAKDCAAGAVLMLAMMSVVVGCIVFVPKLRAAMGW